MVSCVSFIVRLFRGPALGAEVVLLEAFLPWRCHSVLIQLVMDVWVVSGFQLLPLVSLLNLDQLCSFLRLTLGCIPVGAGFHVLPNCSPE